MWEKKRERYGMFDLLWFENFGKWEIKEYLKEYILMFEKIKYSVIFNL